MVAQGKEGQRHGGIVGTQSFEGNLAVKHVLVQTQSKGTDRLAACYPGVASVTFHWGRWLARRPAPALTPDSGAFCLPLA